MTEHDFVDDVLALWREQRPELDFSATQVVDRLLRLSQIALTRAEAVCREHGVSFWGFAVLAALRRAGAPYQLTPTSLYRSAMVSSGAVTKRTAELERQGLVQRLPDPRDRRGTLVRLTRKGKRVIDAAVPAYLQMQRELLAALDGEERDLLASLLRSLLLAVDEPTGPDRSVDARPGN